MTNKTQRELVVFDIDGTLLNSMPKLTADARRTFQRLGLGNRVTDEQIRNTKDWYELVAQYGISREQFDRELNRRKSWTQSLRDGEAPLFGDVRYCLEALTGASITLAALTRSDPKCTAEKIDYHGLSRYFGGRVAVTPVTAKSKEAEALELVKRVGAETVSRAYFIGDKPEDVQVAPSVQRALGVPSTGIYLNRNGSLAPGEVHEYCQIRSLEEIPAIVGGYNGR